MLLTNLEHCNNSSLSILTVDQFTCFVIQPRPNRVKIMGKTRIPDGEYPLVYNTTSNMHQQYAKRFPEHIGMLELKVPNYTGLFIHIGNTHRDTEGCILPCESVTINKGDFQGLNSLKMYRELYKYMLNRKQIAICKVVSNDFKF